MKQTFTYRLCLLLLATYVIALPLIAENKYNYGSEAVANATPTGGGTVYVAAPSGGTSGSWGAKSTASKKEDASEQPTHSYTFQAKTNSGYTFNGWYDAASGGKQKSTELQYSESVKGKKDGTESITRYARWTGISYSIQFNGNGATSGIMSNLAMTYGTAKNLTTNTYERAYTVTYNADGGTCGTSSATATYSFKNWNTNADGTGTTYTDKQSVNNLTTTADASINLYAQWTSASVTLPSATKTGKVLEGWYNGTTNVGEAGDTYTPTATVELKAKWIDKYTPEITGASAELSVDEQQANAFTFTHVDNPTPHITHHIDPINNGNGMVIEYDAANNKIIAHNAGTATIYFTQDETSTIKSGTSATYTYTVKKYVPTFTLSDNELVIDETATLTLTDVDGASVSVEQEGSIISYANGTVTALAAGKAKLTVTQPETRTHAYKQQEFEVSVIKKTPSLTVQLNGSSRTSLSLSYNATATFGYTGKVSDADVQVEQVDGSAYVTFADNKLKTYYAAGTAHFKAVLPETDTYKRGEYPFTITVNTPNDYLPVSGKSYTIGSGSATDWTHKYETLHFNGIPDKLSFNYAYIYTDVKAFGYNLGDPSLKCPDYLTWAIKDSEEGQGNVYMLYVEESADGSNWTRIWDNSAPSKSSVASGDIQLNKDTRYVRFHHSSNFSNTYSNIKITELKYVEDPEPASIDLGTAALNAGEVSETALINWCNIAPLTVTSSNSRFTVSPASFGNYLKYGSQELTISYTHTNVGGAHEGDITITNGVYTKTIHVTAETTKYPQEIIWNDQLAATGFAMNVGESYPDETIGYIAAVAREDAEVTFESANSSIIAVEEGKLVAKAVGSVEITARQAGDEEFQETSSTKTFVVTNLQKQTITWNQNLLTLLTTSGTVELTATASSGGAITYASADESIVKVEGNVLTVVGEGETTITATQAGGNIGGVEYLAISQQNNVIVRNPASQCNSRALSVGSLELSSSKKSPDYTLSGIPERLIFTARHDTKSGSWGTAVAYSELIVEQYACINNVWDWYEVFKQVVGTSDGNYSAGIDESAKKLRFRTNEPAKHTISGINVTNKKFMRADVEKVDMEIEANAIWSKKITVSHSNIDYMTLTSKQGLVSLSTATLGEGCGDFGDDDFTATFTPLQKYTHYYDTIVITDRKAQPTTIEIPVHFYTKGLNQTISGFEVPKTCVSTDLLEPFSATASTGLPIVYHSSDSTIAYVDGNNRLYILSSGTVSITAHQDGDNKYDKAEETQSITITKATPAIATVPTSEAIQYLQTLENSTIATDGAADITLRGEEHTPVAGKFAWSNPTQVIKDNAGTHNYEVTFTPTDGGMYTTNTCMVPVTILRAPQAIAMNNGTVRVAVDGIDAGASDSKLDLNSLIESQTQDVVNSVKRDGAVTYEIISANANKATINGSTFSATAIGDYTIRATKAQTDYYNAVTAEFTVTVTKRANTMATAAAYTQYVDDTIKTVATVVNSDGEIHTSSTDATIAYYDIVNNKIVIPNSEAKSFDQTEVTIKIWQDGTTRFEGIAEADAKTITLTVKKYDNAILVKGVANYVNTITTDSYDNGFVFTANNTDYTNSPIIVTQTEGNEIATYYDTEENPKVVYSNSKLGTAIWSVTQAESYKYKAASNSFTVKVENAAMGQCFMYEDNTEYTITTHIVSIQGEETDGWLIPDAQNAQSLYYDARKTLLGAEQFYIQYSKNGTDWIDLHQPNLNDLGTYTTYGPIDVSNIDFDYLRATAKTGATLTKYVKNIRLTRKPNLSAEGIRITKTADNQTLYFGNVGAGKVNVNWSVVDGGDIHVVSDNDKFTIPQDVIPNTECNSGTTPVTILYHPTSTSEESATITIYNTNQRVEVTVTGKADKAPQTIVWYINGEAVDTRNNPKPAVRTTDIITARTNRNHEVTFTSVSNAELMEITANGTLIPLQEGEVTVYAHGAVDEEDRANYAEVNDQLTFVVTEAAIQTIVWDQTFLGLDQNIEDIPLTAYAKWTDENGNEQRREVTYTVADESVAQVVDGKLDILTPGTTIITATAPGGEENGITFLEAIATKKIVVRDPNADCDGYIYTQSEEKSADCGWNLTHKVDRSIIFDLSEYGEPRTCNFDYTGASHKDLVGVYYFYAGTVKVEQYLSTTNQWVEVETSLSSYSKGSKDGAKGMYVNSGDIQLDAHATKIQVSVYGAVGYFYVNNMQITLARYIETDQETMELGEHSVGEVFKNEVPLEISYSNVAGPITITSSKPDLFYVAEENRMLAVECGAEGMKAVNVYYHPVSDSESDEAVLTISDGKMTKEVALHASTADLRYIFNSENTTWEQNNNWVGKDAPTSGDYVVEIQTDVVLTSNVSVYSLTIDEGATLTIGNGGVLTIGDGNSSQKETYGNLHVAKGGKVVLTTGELIVNDFVLEAALGNTSQSAASGQLLDENNMLRLINDAYFQISFDPKGAITYGWYDFTVPFEVDLMTGVFDENGNKLTYNVDYAVMEYSEAKRAAKAIRPWTWFSGTTQPGKLYTITLDDEKTWNTFLFKKKTNTAISINDSFNALCTETADTKDKGWNGLGNGMLQHCQLNNLPAQTKIQICDHENERYVERDAADYTYAVGTAFFIQVDEPKTIDLTAVIETRGFLAPMRENRVTDEFRLALVEDGQTAVADHLWVSANEEANGDYVIGRDLLKMGTPTNAKVAQMWAIRNDMILCDAEMPLIGNEANVNISLYAPKEAVYTIGVEKAPEDAELYLTYNGQVIWNLTTGAYTVELAKGTTTGYGLRIEASQAPQIATGVENTATDTQSARKVLINNTLYIVTPDGKMYDAAGKNVQ